MRDFQLINVDTIEDAVYILSDFQGNARVLAGGTDIIGGMKRDIYPEALYPELLINIQNVPDLNYIKEEDGILKIGALTKLKQIADDELVKSKYTALAQAAAHTASPHLRQMGTIAGNICQETRCWYYRSDNNYFECKMKGGKMCYAAAGDNRYHSIFGAVNGCFAVNPSDTAPALLAFGAKIKTNQRIIDSSEFWTMGTCCSTILGNNELVLEIQIPEPKAGTKSVFQKMAKRKSIDFAIINCAVVIGEENRIVLNGVFPVPYRAVKAEDVLKGKKIEEALAAQAGEAAVTDATPLKMNKYKVEEAKVMVKRAIMACQ